MGAWTTDSVVGLAQIATEINRQAAMIGYLNAFGLYILASALAVPAILFVAGKARARNM
jgi:DHA2 family multidrug resistance protein